MRSKKAIWSREKGDYLETLGSLRGNRKQVERR